MQNYFVIAEASKIRFVVDIGYVSNVLVITLIFFFFLCRIILMIIIVIILLIENLTFIFLFFTNCYILKSNFLPWNYIIIFQNCWHFLTYWIKPGWNEIYTLISLISCYIWYSITQDGQTKNDANLVFMIFNFHGFMKTLHCINKKLKF